MRDHQDEQIPDALARMDAQAAQPDLPSPAQAWSRVQFRLAYRTRRASSASQLSTLLVALYVLAFLMWMTWSVWFSAGLLAVLATAVAIAMLLSRHVLRSFRN
jgi:hypothetical protein